MSRWRSIIGVLMLCTFALAAVFAATASAEDRAYTCEPVSAGATFSDAHCVSASAGPAGFKHTLISAANTPITATNAKTSEATTAAASFELEGEIAAVKTRVRCTGVAGIGELTNAAASVTGTITIEYSGCTVVKPAGRGCVVKGGKFTTNLLKFTTVGQAANTLNFAPNAGIEIAAISLEGCLNNKPPAAAYPVAGSYVATTSGATAATTIAAVLVAETLTFAGNKAGIEGALTISMKEGNAIVLT